MYSIGGRGCSPLAADRMIARVPANAEKNRLNKQLGILAIYCIKF